MLDEPPRAALAGVLRSALLAGFGRDNVRVVPHDAQYAMKPDALADAVASNLRGAPTRSW